MPIKVVNAAGLAKMFDPMTNKPMAKNTTKPMNKARGMRSNLRMG